MKIGDTATETLTYQEVVRVNVYSNGKWIGDIRQVRGAQGGVAFYPLGGTTHGDIFNTVEEVKATL